LGAAWFLHERFQVDVIDGGALVRSAGRRQLKCPFATSRSLSLCALHQLADRRSPFARRIEAQRGFTDGNR